MAAANAANCTEWLRKNFNLNVRKEWVDACVVFLKQEHQNGFSSQTQLNNLLYEQLLMADFQEMSLGSLPNLGSGQITVTVQGKHTLQINSVIDVGQSAYSQIQKLKGKDDPESQKENAANNWETKIKPSRMLYLQLTDGSKCIQGMEYQTIPCLNQTIAPGTKIQIQGPVRCRLEVLLLTAKNVHILGGSVEEMAERNSKWNILHNAVGQEAPPPPVTLTKHDVNQEEPTEMMLQTGADRTDNSQVFDHHNGAVHSRDMKQKPVNKSVNQGSKTNKPQNNLSKRPEPHNSRGIDSYYTSSTRMETYDERDFFEEECDENFDFDQLDQIEQEAIADDENFDFDQLDQIEQEAITSDENFDFDQVEQEAIISDENFDFDQLDQMEHKVFVHKEPSTANGTDQYMKSPDTEQQLDKEYMCDDDFMDEDFEAFDMDESCLKTSTSVPQNIKSTVRPNNMIQKNASMANKVKSAMNKTLTSRTTTTVAVKLENAEKNFSGTSIVIDIDDHDVCGNSAMKTDPANQQKRKDKTKRMKRNLPFCNSEPNTIDQLFGNVKREKSNGKVDSIPKTQNKVKDTTTLMPFTYLSHVLKALPFSEDKTVRIKGFVSTLVSHSQISNLNQRWTVTVKINDGTATIVADLGDKVLTELLGCPLESFQCAMVEAKQSRNPTDCQALQQQTVQFQRKLSMVSCLMDVLFSPTLTKPLVLRISDPSHTDIQGLVMRVRGQIE